MPGFPWLQFNEIDGDLVERKMRTLKLLGDPYTDEQIDAAQTTVQGSTEMDALIAYLQFLGLANNGRGQKWFPS